MMSVNKLNEITPVTLDSVMKAFKKWRSDKSSNGGQTIPNELWEQIFELEANDIAPRVLKSALSISSNQYRSQQIKREQAQTKLDDTKLEINSPKPQAIFSEAVITSSSVNPATSEVKQVQSLSDAANETRQQIKQLKINNNDKHNLNTDTVIVECIHSDGHKLRIHVTSKRMPEIFDAFFQQSSSISLSC
jgi:hypothetical protein